MFSDHGSQYILYK